MKKYVDGVLVDLTEEEVTARQAEEAEWKAGADARTAEEHRETRNGLLAASDWTQMPDSPLTTEVKTSWVTYRTALRDLPSHSNWPNLEDSDWPTKPS
jgi:hypothetical protein